MRRGAGAVGLLSPEGTMCRDAVTEAGACSDERRGAGSVRQWSPEAFFLRKKHTRYLVSVCRCWVTLLIGKCL